MPELAPFIDVEHALMDLFADLVDDPADVVTVLPNDLQARLAVDRQVIRVRVIGGSDDRISDHPRVDVEVFGATRAVAKPLAETIRQRLISGGHRTAHGVIDHATTEVGPQETPYDDPDVRRWSATYRLSTRRRRI
jgi:hypothetical protein